MKKNWMQLALGFNIPPENLLCAFTEDQNLMPQFSSFQLTLILTSASGCEPSMQVPEICASQQKAFLASVVIWIGFVLFSGLWAC
jgi:hypothetical protein